MLNTNEVRIHEGLANYSACRKRHWGHHKPSLKIGLHCILFHHDHHWLCLYPPGLLLALPSSPELWSVSGAAAGLGVRSGQCTRERRRFWHGARAAVTLSP